MKTKTGLIFCLLMAFCFLSSFNAIDRNSSLTEERWFGYAQDVTQWELDKEHSNICFTVYHLGIAEVKGFFKEFSGTMESSSDDFSDADIAFVVNVNSIDSNSPARDTHLKSNDFFNAVQFPEMKFEGKSFKKQKGNEYKLTGELTIRDVTKKVSFDVEYLGRTNVVGIGKIAFKGVTTINRFEYSINWNQLTPEGTPVLGADVTIELNIEFSEMI